MTEFENCKPLSAKIQMPIPKITKPTYFATKSLEKKSKETQNKTDDLALEELNIPKATLHCRIVGLYTRDDDMNLHFVVGRFSDTIQSHWSIISKAFYGAQLAETDREHGVNLWYLSFDDEDDKANCIPHAFHEVFETIQATKIATHETRKLRIAEIQLEGETQIRGIIMVDGPMSDFDKWFEALILSEAQLYKAELPVHMSLKVDETVEKLVNIFDKELRNVTHDDKWNQCGRAYFADRVKFFVSRNATIEACLPAFPCKSSNTMKVAGVFPDKGEELALRRILKFSEMVKDIYSPGIKMWIVSDGHVFSDCIGVDDGVVDQYGKKLQQLYQQISKDQTIGFCSLPELFTSRLGQFDESYTKRVVLRHYLNTEIETEAEVCREILMSGCSTDPEILRSMIDANDAAKIALYRGFSKFMFEDLAEQTATLSLGNKARRKLASKVAFEMIKRNEAYSNLVGLVFPYHLRLSIHAHNNSGPKFGIRLLSYDKVRTVKSLTFEGLQSSDDLLHIPTPWHNCVVEIKKRDCFYVVKSKVVKDALETNEFSGGWVEGSHGEGGRFVLEALSEDSVTSSSESDGESTYISNNLSPGNISSSSSNSSFCGEDDKYPQCIGIVVDEMLQTSDVFEFAKAVSIVQQHYPRIQVQLIGNGIEQLGVAEQVLENGVMNLKVSKIAESARLDVLYVPGPKTLCKPLDGQICELISTQYGELKHIISPGTGAAALSQTGILDGKRASIPDSNEMLVSRRFENVKWVNKPWTCDHNIWTSFGGPGSTGVIVEFVKEVYGEPIANELKHSLGC